MKRFTLKDLMDNKRVIQLLSIVVAMICWIAVAMTSSDTRTRVIPDVPVDLSLQGSTLKNLGLNIIEGGNAYVDVTVQGPRTVVGQLTAEDLPTTARISGITEAGPYNVTLISANSSRDLPYEIVGYSPSTIPLRIDRLETVTLPITPVINGISIPPDYVMDEEYVNPPSVTITGPQTELEKIRECTVTVELQEPLTRTYASEEPIRLLDVEGKEINAADSHLTLDLQEAQVVVPVLKTKGLPVVVGFTNVPMSFPLDELLDRMFLSADAVTVAGPVNIVDNYQEIRVGYINMKELSLNRNTYNFPLELPSAQFRNMDNVASVEVRFDTQGLTSATFQVSNFQPFNIPYGYDVRVLTSALYNIEFIGDKEVLAGLAADDIVAELDLSEKELSTGQFNYPIKISVPTKGLVWAVGDHSVIIQVSEAA